MAWKEEDDEIQCDILEYYGIFSGGNRKWNKEVNLVSWNGRPAKLDIRNWQNDHEKCGKGITVSREEAEQLIKLLGQILKGGVKAKKAKPRKEKKIEVPKTLEPCYDELELVFGEGPDRCKTARNELLKKYHPDKNPGNPGFSNRKTIKIKEAYEKILEFWNHIA
jgi:hypothetical protein